MTAFFSRHSSLHCWKLSPPRAENRTSPRNKVIFNDFFLVDTGGQVDYERSRQNNFHAETATPSHESHGSLEASRGFASQMGTKSASLRYPVRERFIFPSPSPVRESLQWALFMG